MALNVSTDGSTISWFHRRCYPNTSSYYEYKAYVYCSYSSSLQSDNSYNITINSFYGSLSGSDHGYNACGANKYDGVCKSGCCSPLTVYLATNLSGSMSAVASYNTHLYANLSGSYSKSIGQTFNLAPGASRTITIGKGAQCSEIYTHTVTFQNTNSKPSPTPPSVSASASCSSSSYSTASFSASVSWGYCDRGSTSSSYTITDASGSVVKSGSGTSASVGSLQANTRYTGSFTVSNGCYSSSASASTVTATGNSLTDITPTSYDAASVRIVPVMGGGYYNNPTHTIQITECNKNAWRTAATSNATVPTVVNFDGLVEETCYQVRCVTTNGSACSYTSPVYQFTTPEKGICRANFTSIESATNDRCSDTWADVCYEYETLLTPATIWVYYRVKDGYDPTWELADERTVNEDSGNVCFRINNIFPNQVVYEIRIETHTEQVDWKGDTTTFTSPICPEVTSDNCASLTYMTEYLCASVKKIIEAGNTDIFANPYSLQLCEPGNEMPTHLTLWSRYLRLVHAYLCILCDLMNLSTSTSGQYLVGEIGWVNILTEIVESQMDKDGWKLATSDAIYKYIHAKLKEVWHYQGTVDVLVREKDLLEDFPNAKTAIVTSENAIYERDDDGNWVKTDIEPEDFGVWHINQKSTTAQAESAWYYWQGTWNNLDLDVEQIEAWLERIEKQSENIVQNAPGNKKKVTIVDKSFDFSTVPNDEDMIYFVVESKTQPEPTYYTVTFMSDGNTIRTQRVIAGGLVGLFTPKKDGNTFTGWTLDGNAFDGTMPITQDITLVAGWRINQVTVEFNIGAAEGTKPEDQTVDYGSTVTLPSDNEFSYDGHTFGGWEWKGVVWSDSYPIYENMVLDAIWEAVTLTVAIRKIPGEPDEIISVKYGETISVPETPVREGYKFVQWADEEGNPFDFNKPITQNTVIVAQWITADVTVTFNAQTLPPDAGETVENPPSQTIPSGGYATEPTVLAENYIVHYWTLDGVRFNFDEPVFEDITLDAVWVPVVEVEFDADGGEPAPETQRVPEGGYATKPEDPVKEGCEFEGWAEEDVPLYTITIDPNTEGAESYEVQVYEGKMLNKPETPASAEGCDFDNWYKEGSDTAYDFTQPVTESFTLVAKWKCKVTVTFDPNMEGLDTFTEDTYIGEPVEKPEDPVDPSGECEFKYWGEGSSDPEPGVFDLENLQKALAKDNPADYFPIGTEIPDTYNGGNAPLIVAQYLDSSNNSKYGGAEGVILIRKYVEPWDFAPNNSLYKDSNVITYYNSYYNNCSETLKSLISDITIQSYYSDSKMYNLTGQKWFSISAYELCNKGTGGEAAYEGIMWDYWKKVSGLNAPDNTYTSNPGRIRYNPNGAVTEVWLRSWSGGALCFLGGSGACGTAATNTTNRKGLLPACFIAKPKE